MNIRIRKGLSLYLIFCCVLVLVLGIGLQTGGRLRQQGRAELVSGTAVHVTKAASSGQHFSGKRLSDREIQQCLAAHRTAEVQENANRRGGDRLLYNVLPQAVLQLQNWPVQEAVRGLQSTSAGNAQMLLENIRCERLII